MLQDPPDATRFAYNNLDRFDTTLFSQNLYLSSQAEFITPSRRGNNKRLCFQSEQNDKEHHIRGGFITQVLYKPGK
ncbi:hypothetical protein [Chromobacterium sphagni]|uniref:hypothetical protein n=1 Tax=Chromobacterium sphagni TaxID=1903179 RepID=UPI0011142912|nr:hypothetical protein [Chromobacterium sphagni]